MDESLAPPQATGRRRPSPQLLLFDFDGTLVDSFLATLSAGNRLALSFGYPPLSEAEARKLRKLSARQILSRSGIPISHLPRWIRAMRKELRQEIPNLQPHPGLTDVLRQLVRGGTQLGIVTSNSRENITSFLHRTAWDQLFTHLECGTLFGKSLHIRRILRRTGISAGETGYVGDELRDIEAARKAGVRAIAISWGFNDRSALALGEPDFLCDLPAQLLELDLQQPPATL
jgi:HAD superfamily hydrolase (TIGR01549 family)